MKKILLCVTIALPFLLFSQDKKTAAILKSAMLAAEKNAAISYLMAAKYKLPNERDTFFHTTEVLLERLKGDTITESKLRIKRNDNSTYIYDGKRFLMYRNTDSVYFLAKTPEKIQEAIENEGFLSFETLYEYILPSKWNNILQDAAVAQITNVSLDTVNKNLCHHIDVAYKDDSTLQNRLAHYWIDSKTFILRKYVYEVDYKGSHQYVEQVMSNIQENPYFLANERILRPLNRFNTDIPRAYKLQNTHLVEMLKTDVDTTSATVSKDSIIVTKVIMIDSTKTDTILLKLPPVEPIVEIAINPTPVTPVVEIKKDSLPAPVPVVVETPKTPISLLQKGELAPNFNLTTADNSQISLQDLRNKVVLINFWDRSCDTCINILPTLQNLQNRYADRGFVVLELYTSDAVKDTFHTLSNVKYKIGLNAQQVATEYHVQNYPTLYLIDRDGKVFDVASGRVAIKEEEWNVKIEACLQK